MQNIKRINLKALRDTACAGWKTTLAEWAKRNPFSDDVELSDEEVDSMFNAANEAQRSVLLKFFKREDPCQVSDYKSACKILGEKPLLKKAFVREKDFITYQLEIMIKAVNFLDNNKKVWKPDFGNSSEYKWLPYFQKNGGGWRLDAVARYFSGSYCSLGFYFKKEKSARDFATKFLPLYNQWLES